MSCKDCGAGDHVTDDCMNGPGQCPRCQGYHWAVSCPKGEETNMIDSTSAEMPRYQCHKIVRALKIYEVIIHLRGGWLHFDEPFAMILFTKDWGQQYNPVAGGYYVVYEDGSTSYSPAEAFESGYRLLDSTQEEEGLRLRPRLFTFAKAMEAQLQEHDAERGAEGWRDTREIPSADRVGNLLEAIYFEYGQLSEMWKLYEGNGNDFDTAMQRKAAHVANYAMMISDLMSEFD